MNTTKSTKSNPAKAKKPQKDQYAWLWTALDSFIDSKNLKHTRQRRLIVESFLEHGGHISAEDLHARVKQEGHNIGLATIYRTLNLLKEGGLAEQKQFGDERSVFEINRPDEHHDHLVCLSCYKVVEFENETIETLQKEVAASYGFTLTSHTLDLYGHCKDCSKKLPQ